MTGTDIEGRGSGAAPASASAATRAVVEEFLGRVEKGDAERIAELFAEEVDWMIAANPTVPWIRPRSTRADVAAHFRELAAGVEPMAGSGRAVEALVVEGNEAMLTGNIAGRVRATGKELTSPFAMRLTVENGEVTRYHLYEDSLAVAAACAPED
ncbi:nuclear transport factor 2 family protein [Streptomyces sp. 8N114]|uniref:nuclear transport factor 2 family protein n=1 Tax=Streptomyces sp. 8N114 TaxID=3457419 RepID=UPI003FD0BFB5